MKFNWGTGITIAIIGFMAFILFMVFKANNTSSDLYAKDYYNQELNYQDIINGKKNTTTLKSSIVVEELNDMVKINFPDELKSAEIKGTIFLYRPSNAKLDKQLKLKLVNNSQSIDKTIIAKGNYTLKIIYQANNKSYYFENQLNIK